MRIGMFATLAIVVLSASHAWCQEGARRFHEDGVEYIETRQTVRQPVTRQRVQQRTETVYKESYVTKMHESHQTVWQPVTQYQWEPRVHGVLNPFVPNTVQYHLVPRTRWEPRTHTIRTPITQRQVTPETRTVEVPVRELGFAEREQVSRTAVRPRAAQPAAGTRTAARPELGGVLRMDGDHPRYGWSGTARY